MKLSFPWKLTNYFLLQFYVLLVFRSQLKLIPQIRSRITFRVKNSLVSIDSNISHIRKIINVEQRNLGDRKCCPKKPQHKKDISTKISHLNNKKHPISENGRIRPKNVTRKSISLKFVMKINMRRKKMALMLLL